MFIKSLKEGERLWIGSRVLRLISIERYGVGTLLIDDEETVTVSWDRKLPLFEDVDICTDRKSGQGERLKLMIDAPLHISIEGEPHGTERDNS